MSDTVTETVKETNMADMPEEKKALLDGNEEFEEELIVPDVSEEPEADTETDTGSPPTGGEPDTGTETVSDDDPHKVLMDELNLGGQYKSSEAALRAVGDQRQRIEDQRQENYERKRENDELRQVLQQVSRQSPPEPVPTPEQVAERFQDDPLRTIENAGFVKRDDLQKTETRLQQLETANARSAIVNTMAGIDGLKNVSDYYNAHGGYPRAGLNPIWDAMMQEYKGHPGIQYMSQSDGIALLYDLVKSKNPSKPPVRPVSNERKLGATTSSTGRRPVGEGGVPNFNSMSSTEIRNWFAERGRID
jgi:regulator of replication initiation timing